MTTVGGTAFKEGGDVGGEGITGFVAKIFGFATKEPIQVAQEATTEFIPFGADYRLLEAPRSYVKYEPNPLARTSLATSWLNDPWEFSYYRGHLE